MTGEGAGIPVIRYRDAHLSIRYLTSAFGFVEHAIYEEDGEVVHAQLTHGTGMVMLGTAHDDVGHSMVYVVVDDVDAHYRRATEAGATIVAEPTEQDYGGSDYTAADPEGNLWSFGDYRPG